MSMKAKCPKCGGAIAISEEMFGQTASCPGCGAKIRVPAKPGGAAGAGSPQPGATPAAPAPAAEPGPPEMPGGPPPLPAQGAAAPGPPEMPQIDPSAGPFVDAGPGADSVAAQVRGRRRPLDPKLVIGAIAVVGVLGLIGLGLALMMGGGGAPDAMRYMPGDSMAVGVVNVSQLLDSSVYRKIVEQNPQAKEFVGRFSERSGVPLEDIRRFTFGGNPDSPDPVAVMELNKAVDVDDSLDKQARGRRIEKEQVGDATIHLVGRDAYYFPPDRQTMVVGPSEVVRGVLNPDRTGGLPPKLEELVGELDFSQTVAVAFVVPSGVAGLPGDVPIDPSMIEQVESVTLHVDVGSDVEVEATLYCKDSETASNLKDMADGLLAMFKQNPNMPDEAREVLDSLSISVSGSRIRASVTISEGLIDRALQDMPGTMPF